MKPFLKWAGNKFRIKEHIISVLPPGNRLIEPFAGSCAIFLNTSYPHYILAERNRDLIHLYQLLQRDGHHFIQYCRQFFKPQYNQSAIYYTFREQFNNARGLKKRSALFLYLNKHGYNGLCRYNSRGLFNVPFGRYQAITCPIHEMQAFYEKSVYADFQYSDFEQTLALAQPGDVVYCDPPYAPLTHTANFTAYTAYKFDDVQQRTLAKLATDLSKRGIFVAISNHDTPYIRHYYRNAKIYPITVQRSISCNGQARVKVAEILAVFDTI